MGLPSWANPTTPPTPAATPVTPAIPAAPFPPVAPAPPSPQSAAPEALTTLLKTMDEEASQQKLKPYLSHFSDNFRHGDGFTRQQLGTALKAFWQEHQTLTYQTKLLSWKELAPNQWQTQTQTTITGTKQVNNRLYTLSATLVSEQTIEGETITQQTVLQEENLTTTGNNPPKIEVNLPTTVGVGQDFYLDVIVKDPLGTRFMLGAALDEPVTAQTYSSTPAVELKPLTAGGLFKIGKVDKPGHTWISAVLLQDGGMVMITRRLIVQ
jgi:hypothetical protein